MIQGGLPREAAASERMRRPLFLRPGAEPGGAEDGLPHFVAYCRKIEDFKPEISLSFPIAKTVGGGGIIKNGIDEMSNQLIYL